MNRCIYVKYNRTRLDRYKTSTAIIKSDSGSLWVEKKALLEVGIEHIRSFEDKYSVLSSQKSDIKYLRPEISDDGLKVKFPYIEGESLAEKTVRNIVSGQIPTDAIQWALEKVIITDEHGFTRNIDAILDNFLYTDDGIIGIDYEWVSKKPVDAGFVRYRVLHSFYEAYSREIDVRDEAAFLNEFGFGPERIKEYVLKEKEFQYSIHGEEQNIFLANYWNENKNVSEISRMEHDFGVAKERLEGLKDEVREKESEIRKMTEIKRLTDNHVTNLTVIIENLRKENEEVGKTLTYLNNHQSVTSKVRRKLSDIFNRKYPRGSVQRKKLEYKKLAVFHPKKYWDMTHSEEGRNLIEGEFAIGDIYKEHKRLTFPVFEDPQVSIVIPVYNQIEYTYACLLSILTYTKKIDYEVIIADDVSKDATKNLDHFASNLIICRNSTNQGFLRNCNQAAKNARGKYILFLNNDTKVTENWLDWLIKLMESDESIGMTGSKLVYPDGRLQEAGGIIFSDGSGWNYGRLDDPANCEYNYVKDVDYISGAAILIRRNLWERIGGFDERFAPAYCEDSDLAFEVRKAGYRVVFQPKSVVIHFEGISNGTDVQGNGLKRYQTENAVKLKEKWADEFKNQYDNDGNPDPFRARERSKGKKIILVIDHYVPTFDKDAGSKTTWQYLQMLVKKGFVVKFLGDNFLHEEPYTTELEQIGIEVLYGARMQSGCWEWIEKHEKDLHLVYLNRPHIAKRYIDFIQSHTGLKTIYYGHDLHFLREEREYELTGDIKIKESSDYWKSVELSLMRKADMNYYPSNIECDCIHKIDSTIAVKAITAYVFETFTEENAVNFEEREGILFVGGFAHPPNTDAVLWFIKNIWSEIHLKTGCNVYIAGSNAKKEITELNDPSNGIIIKGFVTEEELKNLYENVRMVIVPLRYGAGVKGKVIEALYYGLPVVTTPTGAEGIPHAKNVMKIAEDEKDMAQNVISLYNDPEKLKKMRVKALEYIKEHNSVDAAWSMIKDDFS